MAREDGGQWRVVYLRVPAELHRRLRLKAVTQDRHASELAREALARYLDDAEDARG